MNKLDKIGQNGAFFKLDKRHQKAVILLFEGNLSDDEIAKAVQRSRSTLGNWKKDPLFKAAQEQYSRLVIKDYKNDALKKIHDLLNAKSEMVQLQSATTILKMAGYLSDNSTPELDEAKVRKAKADAELSEIKVDALKGGKDAITQIVFSDDMKPDEDEERENDGNET